MNLLMTCYGFGAIFLTMADNDNDNDNNNNNNNNNNMMLTAFTTTLTLPCCNLTLNSLLSSRVRVSALAMTGTTLQILSSLRMNSMSRGLR